MRLELCVGLATLAVMGVTVGACSPAAPAPAKGTKESSTARPSFDAAAPNDGGVPLYDADVPLTKPGSGPYGAHHTAKVATDGSSTCFISKNGKVRCSTFQDSFRSEIEDVPPVEEVAMARGRACARTERSEVWCWSYNPFIDAMNGSFESGKVDALGENVVQLAASERTICARSSDGSVWCFRLDQRQGRSQLKVKKVPDIEGAVDIVGINANEHRDSGFCATLASGRIVCWGNDSPVLRDPAGVHDAVRAASGAILSKDGSVYTAPLECDIGWSCEEGSTPGTNWTSKVSSSWTRVPSLTKITDVATAGDRSCVLRSDHRIVCWGCNGRMTTRPAAIPELFDVVDMVMGENGGLCVLDSKDNFSCWELSKYAEPDPDAACQKSAPPVGLAIPVHARRTFPPYEMRDSSFTRR